MWSLNLGIGLNKIVGRSWERSLSNTLSCLTSTFMDHEVRYKLVIWPGLESLGSSTGMRQTFIGSLAPSPYLRMTPFHKPFHLIIAIKNS